MVVIYVNELAHSLIMHSLTRCLCTRSLTIYKIADPLFMKATFLSFVFSFLQDSLDVRLMKRARASLCNNTSRKHNTKDTLHILFAKFFISAHGYRKQF